MLIAGFTPLSLVDYPGHASAVLFTQGCNLCCPFCHNAQLIPMHHPQGFSLTWESVRTRLVARKSMVSALVISGGEPTLQADLIDVLVELRALGFLTKLDTNGTLPTRLEMILQKGLVDYVALDVKSAFNEGGKKEAWIRNYEIQIQDSIALLAESSIPYELRTTCHNDIDEASLKEIAYRIPDRASWYIQKCNSQTDYKSEFRSAKWAQDQINELSTITHKVKLRGWSSV
jgi:pyruvate formate lyase activating enzyme